MHKLMPLAVSVLLLFSSMGSVVVGTGPHGQSLQGICRAPDWCLSSILNSIPYAREVPVFLESKGKVLEANMPGLATFIESLPVGKGSDLEKWILGSDPHLV